MQQSAHIPSFFWKLSYPIVLLFFTYLSSPVTSPQTLKREFFSSSLHDINSIPEVVCVREREERWIDKFGKWRGVEGADGRRGWEKKDKRVGRGAG